MSGKLVRRVSENTISVLQHEDLPLGQPDIFFSRLDFLRNTPEKEAGAVPVKCFLARRV
jgi:hypothetical protein